ncbi:MAG: 3'-5' exonuclease [Sulfurovum sp.]|nr:3'-5' exonuclease [Sulfurovum sp.]
MCESDAYYKSEWKAYLDEIKLEDFKNFGKGIVLSTIHKSKGMEFDKVFLLNNIKQKNSEVNLRLYYVGMTRAKSELNIFTLGAYKYKQKEYVRYYTDKFTYSGSGRLFTHIMNLKDISLGFDYEKFGKKSNVVAGIEVKFNEVKNFNNLCIVYKHKPIAVVSNKFQEIINKKLQDGFSFDSILIEYVVVWYDEQNKKELKHPLCRVVMKK